MSTRTLNHTSDIATQRTNTPGEMTSILEIEPDDGTLIRLLNLVAIGAAEGIPIFADLNDSNDNDLPTDTELMLMAERPTDDTPVAVSVKEDNIASRNQLTIANQRDRDNIDAVKHELRGGRVNIRDKDILYVMVDSAAQIDWSNSEMYFAREGVRELPLND